MEPDEVSAVGEVQVDGLGLALAALLDQTTHVSPAALTAMVDVAGRLVGAASARLLIVDYSLTSVQALGEDGPTGVREPIDGTLAGRAFTGGEIVVSGHEPVLVLVPLAEGSERLGVLELTYDGWSEANRALIGPVVRLLALTLIRKRR
jgi:hypothetical protein